MVLPTSLFYHSQALQSFSTSSVQNIFNLKTAPMTSQIKPLQLYGGILGPNPGKVSILLTELDLPFEPVEIAMSDVKNPEYTALNPNGRLPTLIDPNTGFKIWESGAIIEYVIEKYDPDHTLSYPQGTEEYYHCKQFLMFQMSGQGPYYGQAW